MKLFNLHKFIYTFIGLLFFGCNVNHSKDIKDTQQKGDKIVSAIFKYKEKCGLFPSNLSELAPVFIDEITTPLYGEKKWDYVYKNGSQEFVLYFWGKKPYDDGYGFFSEKGKWLRIENSF
jgi:hypothetical protein